MSPPRSATTFVALLVFAMSFHGAACVHFTASNGTSIFLQDVNVNGNLDANNVRVLSERLESALNRLAAAEAKLAAMDSLTQPCCNKTGIKAPSCNVFSLSSIPSGLVHTSMGASCYLDCPDGSHLSEDESRCSRRASTLPSVSFFINESPGAFAVAQGSGGPGTGGWHPLLQRLYVMQGGSTANLDEYHYYDRDGTLVSFPTRLASNPVAVAFEGTWGWHAGLKRLYLPAYRAATDGWAYFDEKGVMTTYTGPSVVNNAYCGCIYHEELDRLYFLPCDQGNQATWHFISSTGAVESYSSPSGAMVGYSSSGYHVALKRIYLIANTAATQSNWHYIDHTGAVQSYAHGLGLTTVTNGHFSSGNGVWHEALQRLYINPRADTLTHWIYFATDGTCVSYAHGFDLSGSVHTGYLRGYYQPSTESILFLAAEGQTQGKTEFPYINGTGTIHSFPMGYTVGANGAGGYLPNGYHPLVDRVYMSPWNLADFGKGTVWSYVH